METFNSVDLRQELNVLISKRQHAISARRDARAQAAAAEEQLTHATEARKIVQTLAATVQQTIHSHIAGIVSRCLKAVFGKEAPDFNILFEEKRGKTEARLVFVVNGEEVDPMFASGGGIIDVASFALRCAVIMLNRPKLRPVLFLDEPFRFLSVEYRTTMRVVLEQLADELGFQFVMVTHIPEFSVGHCVNVMEHTDTP